MEKNSETSKTFTHMVKRFLTKVVRSFNGRKTLFPKMVMGELDIHMPRNEAQFSSVTQSCPNLWLRGLQHARPSIHHHLWEFTQTHIHWVGDAIQPPHPLLIPYAPIFNLSQHQGLFKWGSFTSGGQSIGVSASASVLPPNIQNWLPLEWTGWISLQFKGLSKVFSNTTVQKQQFSGGHLSL